MTQDIRYYDVYDKVYFNAEKFNAAGFAMDDFTHIVSRAFDALKVGGAFIIDTNGALLDQDYIDIVLGMFFQLESTDDGIYTYIKTKAGIEAENLQ